MHQLSSAPVAAPPLDGARPLPAAGEHELHSQRAADGPPPGDGVGSGPSRAALAVASLPLAGLLALPALLAPAQGGFYTAAWAMVGIASLAIVLMLLASGVAAPRGWRSAGLVASIAIVGYATLTVASVGWASDRFAAWEEGGRAVAYAACFIAVVLLARVHPGRARSLLPIVFVGPFAVAVWMLLALPAHTDDWFFEGRLLGPVGYYNAQAAMFALPVWVAVAFSTLRSWHWTWRGAAVGMAACLAAAAVLPQSRGTLLVAALVVPLLLALAPSRLRMLVPLGIVTAAVAVSIPATNAIFASTSDKGAIAVAAVEHARLQLLAVSGVALIAGLVWAWIDAAAASRGRVVQGMRTLAVVTIAAALLGAGAIAVVERNAIEQRAHGAWTSFTTARQATPGTDSSRLTNLSNNGRLYLWRAAVDGWREDPLRGVGAGNYEAAFYRHRDGRGTYVRQPHSLWLEALSERGVAGLALLALFVAAVLWAGLARRPQDEGERVITAALLVTFVAWSVHAQVEWFWQYPGVTLLPLACAALLVARRQQPAPSRALHWSLRAGAAGVAITGVAVLGSLWLADRHQEQGVAAAAADEPTVAVAHFAAAQQLTPDSFRVTQRIALAHEQARMLDLADAAVRRQVADSPRFWATYLFASDYYRRTSRAGLAAACRSRARELNPQGWEFVGDSTARPLPGGPTACPGAPALR